jgi:glycosyltransferase involved in cell wall biosynthesis
VAPLADTPRNTRQGCCPLKILESLAGGTAVVASDLPVVRDLIEFLGGAEGTSGVRLARADRPAEFALELRKLLDDRSHAVELGRIGRALIEKRLTWSWHRQELLRLYADLPTAADDVTNNGGAL